MRHGLILSLVMILTTACASLNEEMEKESVTQPTLWVNPAAHVQIERGTRKEPFLTLKAAFDHSAKGTRIHLAPATYRINLPVDKSLELIGDKPAGVVLRAADPERPVIEVMEKAGVALRNLEIRDGSEGVCVGRLGKLYMDHCQVADNTGIGVDIKAGNGSWSQPSPMAQLSDCTITNNQIGLSQKEGELSVLKCKINGNHGYGLVLQGDANLGLVASSIDENTSAGVLLDLGRKSKINLFQNDLLRNGGDGVRIIGATATWRHADKSQVQVERNNLTSNGGYGIAVLDSAGALPAGAPQKNKAVHLVDNRYVDNKAGLVAGIEAQ